ncbi:MAG: hypothetical protein ACI81R_003785 [Bradymonadia bacterium]|jgi:hypothetical protein
MMTFGRALTTTMFRPLVAIGFACALCGQTLASAHASGGSDDTEAADLAVDADAPNIPNCEPRLRAEVARRGWSLDWQRLSDLSAPSVVDYTEARRRASSATIALVVTPTRAHVDARFLSHREERRITRSAEAAEHPGCAILQATLQAHDEQRQRRQRYLWVAALAALISAAAAAKARALTRADNAKG